MEWKDATSYSQGDRAKGRRPNAWSIQNEDVTIWIGSGHLYRPGEWVMHCRPIGLDTEPLHLPADTPLEKVKAAALLRASEEASRLVDLIAQMRP